MCGALRPELYLEDEKPHWTHSRTKNGLPHLVPLTPLEAELFREAVELSGDSPFVFLSARTGKAIRESSVTTATRRLFKRLGIPHASLHDMRRTANTGMAKLGVAREHRERILNQIKRASYNVYDYTDEKREALEKWEQKPKTIVSLNNDNVIPFHSVAGSAST